jgi:hypothetical protein
MVARNEPKSRLGRVGYKMLADVPNRCSPRRGCGGMVQRFPAQEDGGRQGYPDSTAIG